MSPRFRLREAGQGGVELTAADVGPEHAGGVFVYLDGRLEDQVGRLAPTQHNQQCLPLLIHHLPALLTSCLLQKALDFVTKYFFVLPSNRWALHAFAFYWILFGQWRGGPGKQVHKTIWNAYLQALMFLSGKRSPLAQPDVVEARRQHDAVQPLSSQQVM